MTARPGRRLLTGLAAGLVTALLLCGVAALTFARQHPVVTATARTVLTAHPLPAAPESPADGIGRVILAQQKGSYTALISSNAFLRRVVDRHRLPVSAAELAAMLTVSSPPGSTVVDLTVTTDDAALAVPAARAAAAELALAIPELTAPMPAEVLVLGPDGTHPAYPRAGLRLTVLTALAIATALWLSVTFTAARVPPTRPLTEVPHVST